ncbi:ABC transporter permease [Fodinisporobacter ferrooxydans]|uniref:ABC transporter permease n=1 Tax=Fodinisporobacter ferrooxydans TaxID=2901836 RepID=A0ABY4CM83_9BACL|nr:ABC transporter permease [Alicyclobacillaceae bacterium MYW30-H2]
MSAQATGTGSLLDVQAEIRKSPFQIAIRRFLHNKLALFGLICLLIVIVMSIGAPLFAHQDPTDADLMQVEEAPSAQHLLGTDDSGRDIWARLLYGGRASLLVGFSTTMLTLAFGVAFGAISGYYGGRIDNLLMRFTEIIQTLPFFLFALTIVAMANTVTVWHLICAISMLGWAGTARIVRGQFMMQRELEYVLSAKAIGCSDLQIIFKHILPNTFSTMIVQGTLSMATYVIAESAFSFLGFGVQEPQSSWGNMLTAAQSLKVMEFEPWRWIPPGAAIILTVLSFHFIGNGLRDAFEPKADH